MANPQRQSEALQALLPPALLLAAGAAVLALAPAQTVLLAVGAVIAFLVTFLNTELAIHLIIVAMLLSPEAVIGGAGLQIGKPAVKGPQAVFRLEDILLAIVGLSWLARTALNKELGLFLRTPLNKPIAAYTVATVLATAAGVLGGTVNYVRGFFFALKYVEYFVLYFMMVNNLRDEAQIRRFLFTGFTTAVIAALVGIRQIPSGERVAAPFEGKYGEPNTFGGYLLFMLALVLALWLQSRTLPAFVGWIGMATLLAVPLLFTLSRASYLGAIPAALALLALTDRKVWVALPLAVAILGGSFVFPKQVQERVAYTYSAPAEPDQVQIGKTRLDSSTSARIESFGLGLRGWLAKPILGWGVTGFPFMDAQYVRTLVETGIVGLASLLWLMTGLFRVGWQAFRAPMDPFYRALGMGYLAGFIGLLVHGLGSNTFIIVRIMEPFWFFTAIMVMLPSLVGSQQDPPAGPHQTERPSRPTPLWAPAPIRRGRVWE